MAVFDYRQSRGREGPDGFLKNFTGYLQTDGYVGYEKLGNQKTLLACMAHCRRYFEHSKDNDPIRAAQALVWIQKLYLIEREARDKELDFDQIKKLRQKESVKILDEFEKWLIDQALVVLPKSAIGTAVNYTLKLWPRLKGYVEDGRLQIDNNLIENTIRPVTLGRKNYLFAGSHEGAQNAAVTYSLLATCKLRGVEPFAWLKQVLTVIPDYPANQLDKLIPGQL